LFLFYSFGWKVRCIGWHQRAFESRTSWKKEWYLEFRMHYHRNGYSEASMGKNQDCSRANLSSLKNLNTLPYLNNSLKIAKILWENVALSIKKLDHQLNFYWAILSLQANSEKDNNNGLIAREIVWKREASKKRGDFNEDILNYYF